jgi:hypothetical protein
MLKRPFSGLPMLLVVTASLVLALSGCARPTDAPPSPTHAPAVTPTEAPTAEPPTTPGKLILVDIAGQADDELSAYLSAFGAENELSIESLTSPELPAQGEETKVIVFLAEPANLSDLVAASPATQFIVVGDIENSTLPNLSVIRATGEDLSFMGGFLAMQIAWDWRSAALVPTDSVMSAEKADAFENGARYVCGQCTPYYAPIVYFPLLAQESMRAGIDAWDAQINNLALHFVNTYYIDPAISTPEVLDRLISLEDRIFNNVYLVGLSVATDERYTAILDFDILPALQELLPQALAGTGGQTAGARVVIAVNNNDQVVTIAKVDNFNRVAADLAAGLIYPLNIP